MKHQIITEKQPFDGARVVAVIKGAPLAKHAFVKELNPADRAYFVAISKSFTGEFLSCEKLALPSSPERAIFLIGLGEKKKYTLRKTRLAARKCLATVKGSRIQKFSVGIDDWACIGVTTIKLVETLATNFELSNYEFRKYKEQPKDGWSDVTDIAYRVSRQADARTLSVAVGTGALIGEYTNVARELSNTPGGDMTPRHLAQEARRIGKKSSAQLKVSVFGEERMKELGMGAILGVSRGSKEEAQFIVLEYRGAPATSKPFVFLGKGITFDSGGLHLKPSNSMDEMHMDMSGGAAVIAALGALAALKVKVHCIGIVPAVENMPSGESYRPGDVLKSMSGKTIEVVSPDAEGRVVLADALTYAKRFDPRMVIDLATLTGACVVALGHHASAILTPDQKLEGSLRVAGESSGEYVWPLPLWEEYEADIKGTVGDILNCGKNREAGTINGAQFLHQFAKDFEHWAHIDIASTMTTAPDQHLGKGASGSGTGLLIELVRAATR
ncbi:MAG: leucyl aminopeptidase [Patescibacteria group bacterium]